MTDPSANDQLRALAAELFRAPDHADASPSPPAANEPDSPASSTTNEFREFARDLFNKENS